MEVLYLISGCFGGGETPLHWAALKMGILAWRIGTQDWQIRLVNKHGDRFRPLRIVFGTPSKMVFLTLHGLFMGLILTTGSITGMILQVVWVHSLPFPVCQSSEILSISPKPKASKLYHVFLIPLQGTNVSHLWKRNIMLKRNIIFPHV